MTSAISDLPYICIQEHRPYLLKFLNSFGVNVSIQHEKGNWFVHGLIKCYHGRVTLHVACYIDSEQIMTMLDSRWDWKWGAVDRGWKDLDGIAEPLLHSSNDNSEYVQMDDTFENSDLNGVAFSLPYAEYTKLAELIGHNTIDIDTRDVVGCNPLLSYARIGCEWAVERLLGYGFDTGCKDIMGGSPLHWASCCGSEKVVQMLLEHGAGVNTSQESGFTALIVAMLHGKLGIFELLLRYNADAEIPDLHGRRALHHAVCLDSAPFAIPRYSALDFLSCLLLDQNVDVDAQDHGGWTALHWAATRDFEAAVVLLLTHNASPNVKDDRGCTPLNYTRLLGYKKMIALLTQHDLGTSV